MWGGDSWNSPELCSASEGDIPPDGRVLCAACARAVGHADPLGKSDAERVHSYQRTVNFSESGKERRGSERGSRKRELREGAENGKQGAFSLFLARRS